MGKLKLTYDDLKNCAALAKSAEDMCERLSRLRAMAERSTAVIAEASGGVRRVNDAMAETVAKLADLEQSWGREIEAYTEHVEIVEEEIAKLPDATQRRILRLRYIDGLTWDQTAKKMHYSQRACINKHDKALKLLGVAK